MAEFGINSKRDLIEKAKSSQFFIVIIASIVVSASIIGTKILWTQRSYQAQIIDAKSEADDKLDQNIKAVSGLKEEFDKMERSTITSSLVLDSLPSKYDFPALLTTIEKMTALSGVGLKTITGQDLTASAVNTEGQPVPIAMPFTVSIGGSYDDIKKFVANMNKSIRPFQIDEIKIDASEGGIEVEFKMTTYYMPSKSLEIRKTNITSGSAPASAATTGAAGSQTPATTDVPAGVDATAGVPQ